VHQCNKLKKKSYLFVLWFLLGNSPASEFYMPTFRNTLSVPSSQATSKLLRLFSSQTFSRMDTPTNLEFSHYTPTCLWRWNRQSVPKRRHIKFRSRGITQKKTYNIKNRAKVWNQEILSGFSFIICSRTRSKPSTFWSLKLTWHIITIIIIIVIIIIIIIIICHELIIHRPVSASWVVKCIQQPLLPKSHPHLPLVQLAVSNEALTTESWRYMFHQPQGKCCRTGQSRG